MIIDNIKNSNTYRGIHPGIDKCFEFIKNNDLSALEIGKHVIEGDDIFVMIQAYEPKKLENGKCEAHKNFIDIQYIIDGQEQMGYQELKEADVTVPYNPDKDVLFVEYKGTFTSFEKDMFAIFFPQDGHMPGIEVSDCPQVRKAVFKIRA